MNPCLLPADDEPGVTEHESIEKRQVQAMTEQLSAIRSRRFVAGHLIWCYADYATRYRGRVTRTAGLFDEYRRPRQGAWLFRARHATEPFVHLVGDWSRRSAKQDSSADAKRSIRVLYECCSRRALSR